MAKKRTKKAPDGVETIGLDIGYGVVKVYDGKEAVTFPAVWGRASEASFETTATKVAYNGDDISDEDGDWIVGDKAMKHITPASLRNLRGRTMDEEGLAHKARLRLAKVAFGKLFPGLKNGDAVHVQMSTGLPVDHMNGADQLKALFIGQHRVHTDQCDFVVHVTECFVMPQPYGTLYRHMISPTGHLNEYFTHERVGVLDVGTYTIDASFDDDGQYIEARSGSIEAGVYMIQQAIAKEYELRHKQKPSYQDIEQGVRNGYIKVRGNPEDFTEVRRQAIDDLCASALNLASRVWQAGADLDVIYITGGGANFVLPAIHGQYPQSEVAENAPTANSEGYRNFAMNTLVEA